MIYGIGTDVCDVRRIRETWLRRGDRFAQRVLGPQELVVYAARLARVEARGISYLATRFSAKEAFSKAIGLGIHTPMTWRACQILNLPSGQPVVRLYRGTARKGERYSARFDASGLPSGVYLCRLMTPEGSRTRKMLYTK